MKKSTPRRTHVPAIPDVSRSPESIDQALRALKENVEVGYGRRGDPLDRFATLRDLRDGGIASVTPGGGGRVMGPARTPGSGGAPLPVDTGPPDYGDDDYSTPTRPTGVRAQGMPPDTDPNAPNAPSLGVVMVTWDSPGYLNHYYAEVYRMPRGAVPVDGTGAPLFDIAANGFRPAYAHGVDRGDGIANGFSGGQAVLAGIATGTIFVDDGLPEIPEGGGNAVDDALSPGRYYYWVRFISRALVPGPVSDRAESRLSINPVRVLDAMTRNVTNTAIFQNLRSWLSLGSDPARAGGNILEYMETLISDTSISSMWSVRMAQTAGGQVFASGFGLGMDTTRTPDGDWESLSTFLINANQFAIMGPNAAQGGALIYQWETLSATSIRLTLATASHGFSEQTPQQRATLMIPSGRVRDPVEPDPLDPDEPLVVTVPYAAWAGAELEVTVVDGNVVTLTSAIDARQPQNTAPPFSGAPSGALPASWMCAVMPGTNIPFIVDTQRNVVGIRGSLIVDGLVRGTTGEFDTLLANTAFIRQLQAEVVNAQVVIGQRIIAGAPGRGSINLTDYDAISNYIVELNNPVTSQFPIRFWKPETGHRVFSLDNVGNLFVGGQMTVGGSAVIAGEASAGTDVIFSTGGGGADTSELSRYALWIGQKGAYGAAGEGRTEQNAIFYVRSDGRAGFNANLFLGGDPFALPSGDGFITVAPRQSGGSARVFVSAAFSLAGSSELRNCWLGADLYLVPATYAGPGAGALRAGIGYDPSAGVVNQHLGMFPNEPVLPGYRVAGTQVDSRQGSRDIKSATIQGSVVVPAGNYMVFVAIWPKGSIGGDAPHAGFTLHPFAVQVSNAATPGLAQARSKPPLVTAEEAMTNPSTIELSVSMLKGEFANIYDDGGVSKLRQADASLAYRADGWLAESGEAGDKVQLMTEGENPWLEGLTNGETYALSHTSPGGVVLLSAGTTTSGHILQVLGRALSATALDVELGEPVERK